MNFKEIQAMVLADSLSTCDAEVLQMVAEKLVRSNQQKADSLQFAISTEIQEAAVTV